VAEHDGVAKVGDLGRVAAAALVFFGEDQDVLALDVSVRNRYP
jgi:hypothetical protein